jgi:hypothetical protein
MSNIHTAPTGNAVQQNNGNNKVAGKQQQNHASSDDGAHHQLSEKATRNITEIERQYTAALEEVSD